MKNVLVLQSGGPTSAINATLAGVVERGLISDKVDKIYGSNYGIKGVLENKIVEIGDILSSPLSLARLVETPGASLGSCRHKLPFADSDDDSSYKTIFARFSDMNIGYVVCIGGNDSMDTVAKLSKYAEMNSIDIAIMGAPKTIDNDLCEMDHSPGFGSAARYVATTFTEIWSDCHVYDIPAVTVVEVMGRHTGWLTASSALATEIGRGPDLIYLPEIVFDKDRFVADVKEILARKAAVIVAVSEGLQYSNGKFVGEGAEHSQADAFGHKRLSGAAKVLEHIICSEIGCKVRAIEFSLMQRASGHLTSDVDLTEGRMLGAVALDRAIEGTSGQVAVLNRISENPYKVKYSSVDVQKVANHEKPVPKHWINEAGNYVTKEMIEYLRPLIGIAEENKYCNGLPNHLHFVR